MAEIFSSNFLITAFAGAMLSAAATALISVFVALKKISYMSEAFAHMSFAGIALALLLGLSMNLITLIFVIGVAIITGIISRKYRVEESNITTILLSVSMAIGIILISLNRDINIDVSSFLFGNVLLISSTDLIYLGALFLINIIFIIIFFKELFYIAYNETIASVYGISVRAVYFLFLIILAANIVISVKISGIILITAQMILPGMTALGITGSVRKALTASAIIALVCTFGGFIVSFYLNMPTGAVIVILLFIVYLVSLFFKYIRR